MAKKTTISQKLVFLSAALFLTTLIVGGVGYFHLSRVSDQYGTVLLENMPKQRAALEMIKHFGQVRVHLRTLGLSGLTSEQVAHELKEANHEREEFEEHFVELRELGTLPGEQRLITELEDSWKEFKKVGEKIAQLAQSRAPNAREELHQTLLTECPATAERYEAASEAIVIFHHEMAEARKKEAIAMASSATHQSIAIIALGALAGLALAWYVSRSINRGLLEITEQLGNARQGVNANSDSISSVSMQLAASSQEQAAAVEQVSASVEEIAGMVSSTVQFSQNVAELVKSGTESMTDLQAAVRQIAESNARVEQLAKLIEDIGEKTELIDEIVFQTRLLSFNASVEAERAGEHGRGFAVVAQEVGNLAQMSGKSASEISQIVKNGIRTAQEVAQSNRARVEVGETSCTTTAQKLEAIQKATQEIMRASVEQNTGIQQINQSIQSISVSTQENASSSEECSASSQSLSGQVSSLSSLVADLEEIVTGRRSDPEGERPAITASHRGSLIQLRPEVKSKKESRAKLPTGLKKAAGQNFSSGEDPWEKL